MAAAAVSDEPEEVSEVSANSEVSVLVANEPAIEDVPIPPEDAVMPCAEDPPAYYRILYEAANRSMKSGEEGLTFTEEEVRELLTDPEFCLHEKETASHLRKLLSELEPGTV